MPWNLRHYATLETTSDELLHLDVMRFIASVGIVLCHSAEFFLPREMRIASHARTAGLALFVDVFFVISGFVIAHIYAERMYGWRDFVRFIQRRVGRLYPLHLLTLTAMAALFFLVGQLRVATEGDMRLVPQCLAVGALLANSVIDCGGPVPNGVNWSISAEMVMYLAFPVLLVAMRRLGRWRHVLFPLLLGLVVWQNGGLSDWGGKVTFARALPAFVLGVSLSFDWQGLARFMVPGFAPALAATGLVAGSLLLWPYWVLLPLGYATAALAISADAAGRPSPVSRRLAPLGQLTYSAYMLHPIVILVIVNALGDKLLRLDPLPLGLLTLASYAMVGALILVSYKAFETPARNAIDSVHLVRHLAGKRSRRDV